MNDGPFGPNNDKKPNPGLSSRGRQQPPANSFPVFLCVPCSRLVPDSLAGMDSREQPGQLTEAREQTA
jgi:hypothetical protein